MEKEIYKEIPGYEGSYMVSNYGNVKSLKWGKERILKPANSNRGGYKQVHLNYNNKSTTPMVHKLVAMAFLGHQPNGLMGNYVDHIDNNKLNNMINNLQIISHSENSRKDKIDCGVKWHKSAKKFECYITIFYKKVHLGLYDNKEDALSIYKKAVENIQLYDGDNKEFREKLIKL